MFKTPMRQGGVSFGSSSHQNEWLHHFQNKEPSMLSEMGIVLITDGVIPAYFPLNGAVPLVWEWSLTESQVRNTRRASFPV